MARPREVPIVDSIVGTRRETVLTATSVAQLTWYVAKISMDSVLTHSEMFSAFVDAHG